MRLLPRDKPCFDHGDWVVFDSFFRVNRCHSCGHRLPWNGEPPRATRRMPPWLWYAELYGRRTAINCVNPVRSISSGGPRPGIEGPRNLGGWSDMP